MNEPGIFDTRKAPKLDSPGRIEELRPYELLKDVGGVVSGMTCLDFGSGTGTFAFPMAELAGAGGEVYAIDNSAEMLERIRSKGPPQNLKLVQSDVAQTGLDDRIADMCLLAFILHEVKQPAALVKEAYRLLKPGGRLVAVDWRAELDAPGPPQKKRISRKQIQQLFREAGLSPVSYLVWSRNHYVATAKK